jgi:hypothetical protein
MKRLITACGLLLCAQLVACSPPFAIFEDVGTDPHPPKMTLVGVAYQPTADAEGITPEPDLQPADGFVIRPLVTSESTVLLRVEYSDVGGDVQSFMVRDRNGTLDEEVTPTTPANETDIDAPAFFSGTSGVADLTNVTLGSNLLGKHQMELWAVDSHGSRSEKVTFTFEVAF